jgi:hypothetical protein
MMPELLMHGAELLFTAAMALWVGAKLWSKWGWLATWILTCLLLVLALSGEIAILVELALHSLRKG